MSLESDRSRQRARLAAAGSCWTAGRHAGHRGNAWLRDAADALGAAGYRRPGGVRRQRQSAVGPERCAGLLLVGLERSGDPAAPLRLRFRARRAGGDVREHRRAGRSRSRPPTGRLGPGKTSRRYFAGSPQSLDRRPDSRRASTGVGRPRGRAVPRRDDSPARCSFPAYVAGFNLAEAFYLAMPYLSWQTVVIGDPLCAPFRQQSLAATDIDRGLDTQTELPVFFSQQRLQASLRTGAIRSVLFCHSTSLHFVLAITPQCPFSISVPNRHFRQETAQIRQTSLEPSRYIENIESGSIGGSGYAHA